jgi:outer membrane protein assembly factor BamB
VFGFGASVVELSASTGNQIWSFATGGPVGGGVGLDDVVTAGGPIAGPDLKLSLHAIIAGDANGDLYALNPKNGKQLWSEISPGPLQTPTIANGVVYVLCSPGPIQAGALEARNASDGSLLFSANLGSINPGPPQSPVVADGDVFTEDNSGDLLIFGLVGTV